YCKDFFLADDQDFFAINFDGLAGIFAEQNFVTNFDIQSVELAVVAAFARADRNDFTLIRLLSSAFRNDDTRGGLTLVVQTFDDHAIVQRTQGHEILPLRSEERR